jgi:hypothetical protein
LTSASHLQRDRLGHETLPDYDLQHVDHNHEKTYDRATLPEFRLAPGRRKPSDDPNPGSGMSRAMLELEKQRRLELLR